MVHNIVQAHEGSMHVISSEGQGRRLSSSSLRIDDVERSRYTNTGAAISGAEIPQAVNCSLEVMER
jgi:hypothetical protein